MLRLKIRTSNLKIYPRSIFYKIWFVDILRLSVLIHTSMLALSITLQHTHSISNDRPVDYSLILTYIKMNWAVKYTVLKLL